MPPKRGKKKSPAKQKKTAEPAPAPAPAPSNDAETNKEQKKRSSAPTVQEILSDKLTQTATEYWAPGSTSKTVGVFKPELVTEIYKTELCGESKDVSSRVMMLEFSCYLENYLWPNFDSASSSYEHVMSIVLMVNEKFKEGVPAWEAFEKADGPEKFPAFVKRALLLPNQAEKEGMDTSDKDDFGEGGVSLVGMPMREATAYTLFLVNCFQSLENQLIRESFLRLVSLPLWKHVAKRRRQMELGTYPQLQRHWDHLIAKDSSEPAAKKQKKGSKKDDKSKKTEGITAAMEANLIPSVITSFLAVLESASGEGADAAATPTSLFLERSMELLIDLLSQLPTRRFLRLLVLDLQVAVRCSLASFTSSAGGKLFGQLLRMLYFYLRFEINDQTGTPLSRRDMTDLHYGRMQVLQRISFKYHGQPGQPLRSLALTGIGAISSREALTKELDLLELCEKLSLLPSRADPTVPLLREVLVAHHEKQESQLDALNNMPLFPTEQLLWDPNLVPMGSYSGDTVLALPKLNLQFLTFHDYLLRSFNLFRLESAYEIREDLVDAIKRMDAKLDTVTGRTHFTGWARMCASIEQLSITEVKKPAIGETKPAEVRAEVQFDLTQFSGSLRREWEELREHDIVFLVTIHATSADTATGIYGHQQQQDAKRRGQRNSGQKGGYHEEDETFPSRYGVAHVRGCEVVGLLDEEGVTLNDTSGKPDTRPGGAVGSKRTLRVLLDAAQYQQDMADESNGDVYESVNLLVRRKAKENNFKAILETIRDLVNVSAVNKAVPDWLHDVFLGYGDPASASSMRMHPVQSDASDASADTVTPPLDFKDTFVTADHARSCFPDAKVVFENAEGEALKEKSPPPPYKVVFERPSKKVAWGSKGETVRIRPYVPPNPGPYPQNQPKQNFVAFTPVQTQAIRAGMNQGLTMVVGPPGTGKTDVAVQVVSNLYHSFPGQRIIMVTHSNQALNDLFSKIMERDIDERHLLRLGSGERDLNTDKDFSKWGRVNYTLQRRLALLAEVERLSVSLEIGEEAGYTCETAAHFRLFHYQALKEQFEQDMAAEGRKKQKSAAAVSAHFPFTKYFATAPQPLFKAKSFEQDWEVALGCFRHLQGLFDELEDYRAFELLRSGAQRADYLLTKQARIIAMTCTHAALVRPKLVKLGFKFDNIVMEESAQILEVETFIPMLLQDYDRVEGCRLKRVILIGDHHQLPPVVKNMAFQKYGHLDQSLFARFVRLGVPTIDLNLQGRARPGIAALYSWRYQGLGNLPATIEAEEYTTANPGLAFDYQVVDVPDFNGRGESTPTPHFFQNLGEAEYCVAMFQYLRLKGYPASKITILTTYNGQRHLIRDVLNQRCAPFPQFGTCNVSTVDRFQGQQNDFIILSLVRTRAIGHLRDVRRLVVAMSRARLGLYVFCRLGLFESCYELTPTFNLLLQRPTKLHLVLAEDTESSTERKVGDDAMEVETKGKGKGKGKSKGGGEVFEVQDVTQMGVLVQQMMQASQ